MPMATGRMHLPKRKAAGKGGGWSQRIQHEKSNTAQKSGTNTIFCLTNQCIKPASNPIVCVWSTGSIFLIYYRRPNNI
jgi:hypothetical protein